MAVAKQETSTDPFDQFEVEKRVTHNLIKGPKLALFFASNIFLGAEIKARRTVEAGENNKPAHLAFVVDLLTGEEGQIIVASVLKSSLEEEYPNQSYVGKFFLVQKIEKKPVQGGGGRAYNTFDIREIKRPKDYPDSMMETKKIADKSVVKVEENQ